MLVQMSDPQLTPLLGSWRLDPLSLEVVQRMLPPHMRGTMDLAMRYVKSIGVEDAFLTLLERCKDDHIVIGARQISFHYSGRAAYTLAIQRVSKQGRKTLLHCIQKPPYPVAPVVYSFHFYKGRLVMQEENGLRQPITHKFFTDK